VKPLALANRNQQACDSRVVAEVRRLALVLLLAALVAPAAARAAPRVLPADRAAINALLDRFVPDVVRGENLAEGRTLVGRYVQVAAVQRYPAKGTQFHGWVVNYAKPGDVGFDILLQPTTRTRGAWSFRAEAQKIGGKWKITTWYTIATFAPPGKTQLVVGPNDFGPGANSPDAGSDKARLSSWVLLVPAGGVGGLALLALSIAGARAARTRARVRRIERTLSG
jgi:hypothetical protein